MLTFRLFVLGSSEMPVMDNVRVLGVNIEPFQKVVSSLDASIEGHVWQTRCHLELTQLAGFKKTLRDLGQWGQLREGSCDWILLSGDQKITDKKWVVFDMDSTIIETEVINEMAVRAGVASEVSAITERAMRGELDFSASFKRRMALLEGMSYALVEEIVDRLPVTPGLVELMSVLQSMKIRTAVISGGFDLFARRLQQLFGFDLVFSHALEIVEGRLTGQVIGEIIDGDRKLAILQQLLLEEGANLSQAVVVGDGANDIPMLTAAGLGIAYRAKPAVNECADIIYTQRGFSELATVLNCLR